MIKPGIYEHYKGEKYKVLDVVVHSETLEKLVLYECMYENPVSQIWVRPLTMFKEDVEINGEVKPRFKFIKDA
jgi:hypothetical protein